MALPSKIKTWRYAVNKAQVTSGTTGLDYKQVMFDIVQGFLGVGMSPACTTPWTCAGSSNSSTAGMDAVNRWSTVADVTWNSSGAAHSWIVLKQTGIGSNFQVLWTAESSSGGANPTTWLGLYVSQSAGFTGGSTTARPTATDEQHIHQGATTNQNWLGGLGAPFSSRSHVLVSDDGACTRWSMWYAGHCLFAGYIERVRSPVTIPGSPSKIWNGDQVPWWGGSYSSTDFTNATKDAMLMGDTSAWYDSSTRIYTRLGNIGTPTLNTANNLLFAAEQYGGSSTALVTRGINVPNDLDGNYPMVPLSLVCNGSGFKGRHGSTFDLYFGNPALIDGDTYPNDSTRQFVQLGDFIWPWDGSIPQLL